MADTNSLLSNAKIGFIVALVGAGIGAAGQLMIGNGLGILIAVAYVAAIFWAYRSITKSDVTVADLTSAKTGAMICAIIGAVFLFQSLSIGNQLFLLASLLAVGGLAYAYMQVDAALKAAPSK